MNLEDQPDTRGGIKGSFPIDGGYASYQYINWACKFFVDSNMMELKVREEEQNRNDNIREDQSDQTKL